MSQRASTRGQNTYVWRNGWHSWWVLGELLARLVARDAPAGEYWRSEYLGLAKLLAQAASSSRAVRYVRITGYRGWIVAVALGDVRIWEGNCSLWLRILLKDLTCYGIKALLKNKNIYGKNTALLSFVGFSQLPYSGTPAISQLSYSSIAVTLHRWRELFTTRYACRKRCHSWRVLEVWIPRSGEIADIGGEFWESC